MKTILLFLSMLVFVQGAMGQWKKIAQFPLKLTSIYFLDAESAPLKGFAGSYDAATRQSIYHTTDGGATWNQSIASTPSSTVAPAYNFSFKDSLTGWVATDRDSSIGGWPTVCVTNDGGQTWQPLDLLWWPQLPIGAEYARWAVVYNKHTDILVAGGSVYSDNGKLYLKEIEAGASNGCVFSNDTDGIIATEQVRPYSRTTDGGFTWTSTNQMADVRTYMPLGIKGTQTFFVAGRVETQLNLHIFRSDDAGLSWRKTAIIQNVNANDWGTIHGDLKSLYVQTNVGIHRSVDEGITWSLICGPVIPGYPGPGMRMYVYGNKVYAADNTGGLWYLDASILDPEPQFSSQELQFNSSECRTIDQILTIASQDPCGVRIAEILDIQITGSPNFSFTADQIPHVITVRDTIALHYSPSSNVFDSGSLYIKYRVGTEDREITIPLYGSATPREEVVFYPSISNNNIASSKRTEYTITPAKAVTGKNLSEISFDVTLDEDLLETQAVTGVQGSVVSSSSTRLADGFVVHHITISGTDISLDPAVPVARFSLLTYVTDTISTPIALSNVRLNSFDPDYERCTLSATSQDTTFTLALLCGDRTLTDFLRHGRSALEITSIRPNPARDEVTVEIVAEGAVTIEVFDAVGKLVQTSQGKAGVVVVPVDKLSSGSYVMRVASGGGVVSRSFAVER